LGSKLVSFALTWWLTEETGSAAVLATSNLVMMLPGVVLGPMVGALIDRWSRRWTMVVADGAIALCTAALAYLYWREIVVVWHVYVILFLRAVGGIFHDPAMAASTSLMVPKEHLARIGGMNATRRGVNRVLGAPLGAFLLVAAPIEGVLAIDIVTAVLAIVPLLFVDVPQPEPQAPQSGGRRRGWRSILADTAAGYRYVWQWKGLFITITSMSLVGFFVVPTNRFTPLVIREHFGGGPEAWGVHSAVVGVGMIGGGLLMSTWGGFRRRFLTVCIGLLGYGLFGIVRGLAPANAFWLWISASFLRYLSNEMTFVPLGAILQSAVPPEMQGRVLTAQNSLFTAMAPLGLAILGPLGDLVGPRPLLVLSGAVVLLLLGLFVLTPSVRNLEDGPPAQAAARGGSSPQPTDVC
jgi:DHA3 family macrolide efflux protein-like MFS transporter